MLDQGVALCVPFVAIGTKLQRFFDDGNWVYGLDYDCGPTDPVTSDGEFADQVSYECIRDRVQLLVLLQMCAQTGGRHSAEAGNADEGIQDRVDDKSIGQKGLAGLGEDGKRVRFALVVRVVDGWEG